MAPNNLQRSVNYYGSRLIPLILLALIGYSVWVEVALIAVDHVLKPSQETRKGEAIAIIVLYFILFIPTIVCYLRLLGDVLTNPGYVPSKLGPRNHSASQDTPLPNDTLQEGALVLKDRNGLVSRFSRWTFVDGVSRAPANLTDFYERDVFECEIDGLPRWCTECAFWKPERSHHSTDVGRCIYKFDHFCPWAGGPVSETSYKWFIQFCTYGALYNLYMTALGAYYVAELNKEGPGVFPNINWIIIIILAGLFFLFASGMTINGFHNILINSTVIDNLSSRHRTQYFAVYIGPEPPSYPPDVHHLHPPSNSPNNVDRPQPQFPTQHSYPTITYPLPPTHPASASQTQPQDNTKPPRTFAILTVPPHERPYKLATPLANLQSVMGYTVWDWLLPLKRSPCSEHAAFVKLAAPDRPSPSSSASASPSSARELSMMYPMGPVLERMIRDAGILPLVLASRGEREHQKERRRRRKPRSAEQNGVREEIGAGVPEGW